MFSKLTKSLDYASSDFIVKLDTKKFKMNLLGSLALFTLLIIVRYNDFLTAPKSELIFLFSIFSVLIAALLIKILDRSPKLIISKEGLWAKKTSLIDWATMWYFSIETTEGRGGPFYKLLIKLKDELTEYKIDINSYDKSPEEIISAMGCYSKPYNVINLDEGLTPQ